MATGLSKIEIITSFAKYSELQSELNHLGVRGMTVMQVMGCGIQKGTKEFKLDSSSKDELAEIFAKMNPVVRDKENITHVSYGTSSRIILHRTRELFSRNTQKQTVSSFVRSLQMPKDLYVRVLEMMFRKNVSMSLQRHILW